MTVRPQQSRLERALGVITHVEPGEGLTALLFTLNIFLLLMAYYVIKPVREGLILAMDSGAEYKSYMGGAIAVALLFAVPAYAKLVDRWQRNRLIITVTLFFVSHLVLFYFGGQMPSVRPHLGLLFYLWVGIFNMMVVAQFWAFANDVYNEEQGKRLFALIAVGATAGAATGGIVVKTLESLLGIFDLLLLGGAILVVCALLTQVIHARETAKPQPTQVQPEAPARAKATRAGAFALVFRHRYLRLLALFSLTFTVVNSNGEYLLGKLVKQAATAVVEASGIPPGDEFRDAVGRLAGGQFAEFYSLVAILALVLQLFVVSRIVKYGGLRVAFLVLPCVALLGASAFIALPVLWVLRIGKIAENGTDYSLNNTVRNMLWLPTTTEMKYKAKQAVDTFFVRMGDVGSSLVVAVLAGLLGLGVLPFAVTNVVLIAAWLVLAVAIIRENRKLSLAVRTHSG